VTSDLAEIATTLDEAILTAGSPVLQSGVEDGERVQPLQERAGAGRSPRDARRDQDSPPGIHRDFLRPETPAFTLGYKSPVQFLENSISEPHQEKRVA
jgi:hypothetical protein